MERKAFKGTERKGDKRKEIKKDLKVESWNKSGIEKRKEQE